MRERWRFSALEHFVPHRQTDRQTEWLLEFLDGAKKRLDSIMIMNSLLFFTAFEWVIKPRPAVTFLVCYNNLQTLCFLHEHIIVLNYRFIALNFSTFTNILKVATIYFAYVNFWRMAFYSYELARIWLLNIHPWFIHIRQEKKGVCNMVKKYF